MPHNLLSLEHLLAPYKSPNSHYFCGGKRGHWPRVYKVFHLIDQERSQINCLHQDIEITIRRIDISVEKIDMMRLHLNVLERKWRLNL